MKGHEFFLTIVDQLFIIIETNLLLKQPNTVIAKICFARKISEIAHKYLLQT